MRYLIKKRELRMRERKIVYLYSLLNTSQMSLVPFEPYVVPGGVLALSCAFPADQLVGSLYDEYLPRSTDP
jgi:hypothetical protein